MTVHGSRRASGADFVRLALVLGVIAGLVEAIALIVLQKWQLLSWDMALTVVSIKIAWISPLFDLLLFGAAGLAIAAAARMVPERWIPGPAIFVLAFLVIVDWLAVAGTGRLSHVAIVLLSAGLSAALTRALEPRVDTLLRLGRRLLPWSLAAVALLAAGIEGGLWWQERAALAATPPAPKNVPNVLVIVLDTVRADHLSTYGYGRQTTPTLDRLGREGVVFENTFAASSWTLPSHASILTGRYPHEHGAERVELDKRLTTLPEVMHRGGYATAAFSANTIYFTRSQGLDRGFVHFEDYFDSATDMAARTLFGRKFEWFVWRKLLGHEDFTARKRASAITRDAAAWLGPKNDRPAFVVVNYFDAHDPYLPPEPYRSRFATMPNPGGIVNSNLFRLKPKMTPAQAQGEIDAYDGALSYMDAAVDTLLGDLRSGGRDWLVVITADHGEAFGEHGLYTHKNSLYTEVIRVPLIVWWPGHVPAGTRVERPVSNVSIAATLLDLIGAEPQATFAAPSLRPLWDGHHDADSWPMPLSEIAQMDYNTLKPFGIPAYFGDMQALVSGDQHYIVNSKLGEELYRWQADRLEERNLAKDPGQSSTLSGFRDRLKAELAK